MKIDLNIGDLILDWSDDEIGTIVSVGPVLAYSVDPEYPDGSVRSWKISWPSLAGRLCDIGEDDFYSGDYEIISRA